MPTTVAGKIVLLDTSTPGTSSFVRFWLRSTRGNEPRITATGAIAPQAAGSSFYVDIPADSSGNVSGSIYSTRASDGIGNGEIEVSGSYIAVYYGMQIYNASIPGPEVAIHAKQGATLLIQNVTPITTLPVATSPTGDTVYARLDGGNSPFSGRIQQNGGDLVVSRTTTDTLTNKTIDANSNILAHLLQSTASTAASGNVTLTLNTNITVLTQAVTMPAAGGPFRVLITYLVNVTATNAGTVNGWVSDGTNTFAGSQEGYTTAGAVGGMNGIQVSPVTYANGAVVTFTLVCRANATMQASQLAANTGGQNTILSVSVISAN